MTWSLGLLALAGISAADAATVTFTGATSSELTTASNYSTGALPASGDTLQFDATTGGTGTNNLALTYTTATSNALGGTAGININVTAGQTGSISIVSGQTGSNTIAFRLNTAALTVAAGAGAFTFGNGGANILPLTFGNGTASTQTFVNNNAATGGAVTFNSDVSFIPGGQAAHRGAFTGTGNFVLNNVISNTGVGTGGTLGFDVLGTGTVTFNGANSTFSGVTTGTVTNGLTIGVANGTSVVRATATQALGTGIVGILGNGAAAQTSSNRLEVSGGISLNNAFVLSGKTAATTGASIVNTSGNNTLSGTMTATTGGNFYQIQSDAGTLTLSNATSFSLGVLTGTRTLTLQGAGNGVVAGVLSNGTSTGVLNVAKDGAGTWTLTGTNTYTGTTTISAGTLQIGNGTTDGSITTSSGITNNAALVYNRVGNFTYGGVISGTGTLTKTGAGTQTLTGTNTYTGATTISAGTLQIGDGTTDGSIAATASITNNGNLTYNRLSNFTYGGVISGTGSITKTGAGTQTLSGANTYSGGTNITGGMLTVTANGALGSGNATVATTATSLTIGTGVTTPFAIGSAATLTLAGGGTANVADVGYLDLTSGANITVNSLVIGNMTAAAGTYSAASPGFADYILGTGTITVAGAVPEPGTWAMLSIGVAGMVGWVARRKRAA